MPRPIVPNNGVLAARALIRKAAADGNKTAQEMLKGVVKDEAKEAQGQEIDRP